MSVFHQISVTIARIGQFWQESINGIIFRWNLGIIIIQFAYCWYKYNDLPPEIPLFYSRPWGAEQLASSSQIFLLPVLSIVIMLLNNLLAVLLLHSHSILSRLLIITSLLFAAFSLIGIFHSISLVT
jgi:hypothetical protein